MLNERIIAELEELNLDMTELAIIKKIGNEWCVIGHTGRQMGCYSNRKAAENRLAQVEMFKHMKKGTLDEFELSSRSWCYCSSCGAEYISNKRCDLSTCPFCQDDCCSYEITGLID